MSASVQAQRAKLADRWVGEHRPAARRGEAVDTSPSHLGFRCAVSPGA